MTNYEISSRVVLLIGSVVLSALAGHSAGAQPPNLDELKGQINQYIASDYDNDIKAVLQKATDYLDAHVAGAANPAIVLDIDETSLSNLPEMKANGFGYIRNGTCPTPPVAFTACGVIEWDRSKQAKAIVAVHDFYQHAIDKHVAVFFITGRHEMERTWTKDNLVDQGYATMVDLRMEPDGVTFASAADFKAAQRKDIVENLHYDILVSVGDQPSDLTGGYADAVFLLPNPFYRIP